MDGDEEFERMVAEVDRWKNTIVGLIMFGIVMVCLTGIVIAWIVSH